VHDLAHLAGDVARRRNAAAQGLCGKVLPKGMSAGI
jgi:hypothetical protein